MIRVTSSGLSEFVAEVAIKKGDLVKPSPTNDKQLIVTATDPTGVAHADAAIGEPVEVSESTCCIGISVSVVRGQYVKPDAANPGKVKNSVTKDADVIGTWTESVVYVDAESEATYLPLI